MKNLFKLQHCIHPLLSILNCRSWIQTRDTLTWMLGMALLLVCQDVAAQIELVKNGKARELPSYWKIRRRGTLRLHIFCNSLYIGSLRHSCR